MRADDFAVARMHLDSRLMNHVEAGIVGKLEYAHWKRHLELDSRIDGSHCDIVPFPAVNCFVHKWNEDAVYDKTDDIFFAEHRLLAYVLHKPHCHVNHTVAGLPARYHFDQRHQLWRVEKVETDKAVRPTSKRGHLAYRQRAGV